MHWTADPANLFEPKGCRMGGGVVARQLHVGIAGTVTDRGRRRHQVRLYCEWLSITEERDPAAIAEPIIETAENNFRTCTARLLEKHRRSREQLTCHA